MIVQAGHESLLLGDFGLACLFKLLSLEDILMLFNAVLLEQKILVVCKNLGLLSKLVYVFQGGNVRQSMGVFTTVLIPPLDWKLVNDLVVATIGLAGYIDSCTPSFVDGAPGLAGAIHFWSAKSLARGALDGRRVMLCAPLRQEKGRPSQWYHATCATGRKQAVRRCSHSQICIAHD